MSYGRETIQDVKIGRIIENNKGRGMITGKTMRTITVTYENGNVRKNTYRHNDDYFYATDF